MWVRKVRRRIISGNERGREKESEDEKLVCRKREGNTLRRGERRACEWI